MTGLEDHLRPLFTEAIMPGVLVWDAGFRPFEGITIGSAVSLKGWDGSALQIGATEYVRRTIFHPGYEFEEDGELETSPAHSELIHYYFLRLEDLSERNVKHAAVHELPIGILESVDVFYATYELRGDEGTSTRKVAAGLRFNQTEFGEEENSFGILQRHADERIFLGAASQIFRELPAYIEQGERIAPE